MDISDDFRAAKQALSGRLLRRGLQGGVVGMMAATRVKSATAMAGRNVHAVGIGYKEVAGKATQDPCIRVHVVQKIAPSLLAPRDAIPDMIDGLPTDIVDSAPVFLQDSKDKKKRREAEVAEVPACSTNRKQRQRPVIAGISAAHYDVTAGTIGYFCRSTRKGDDAAGVYLLSNNHVFADVNQGHTGDAIYQPGPADGGVATDVVATLARYVPILLDGIRINHVDAAIAEILPEIEYDASICSIGTLTGTERATVGTKVRKHGRTTGYTEGEVSDEAYDALVGMDHSDPNVVALFEDQLRIRVTPPYSAIGLGGDSGSMVVQRKRQNAVGLYCAGPPRGDYGIANPIEDVLNEMEIQLL